MGGATAFVPREEVQTYVAFPALQSAIAPTVVTVEPSLTRTGPPIKGWSWKVSRNQVLANERALTQQRAEAMDTASTSAAVLVNSFAALSVDPLSKDPLSKPYFEDPFEET